MNKITTQDQQLKFFGLDVGARMTAVTNDNREVFVHSPIRLTDEIAAQLDALGTVRAVIAPNKMHHLYVGDFKTRYPQAEFFCAPGLQEKRKDFQFTRVISNEQNFPWNPTLMHIPIEGIPFYNEVVFFHPHSRTLILTDLVTHFQNASSFTTRIAFKLMGTYGHFGWSSFEKFVFIKNKKAFRESFARLLEFDFDRVIMAHGEIVERDGKRRMAGAFT